MIAILFAVIAIVAIGIFIFSLIKYSKEDEGDWLPVVMISLQVVIISIIVICFVLWWR